MIVSFCGHSEIPNFSDVETWLYKAVESTILNGAKIFYLGGYGSFDILASRIVTKLKIKYPYIERVLVIPYLSIKYDKKFYDSSYYPCLENVPKKFAISRRSNFLYAYAHKNTLH